MATISELEANICPQCKQPMEEVGNRSVNHQADHRFRAEPFRLITFICRTPSCEWEDTGRVVQLDAAGQVCIRNQGDRGMDKDWKKMSNDALDIGKRQIEELLGRRIEDDNRIPTLSQIAREEGMSEDGSASFRW